MEKEILTIEEVSAMFKVCKRTIYNLLRDNKLPGVKIGGQWRFLRKDLMKIFMQDINNNKRSETENDREP